MNNRKILIEKLNNINENQDFEQNNYSRTPIELKKIGHSGIRSMKWLPYYDKFYENINYFDSMASVLTCVFEMSER